jgi:hypothetical protein
MSNDKYCIQSRLGVQFYDSLLEAVTNSFSVPPVDGSPVRVSKERVDIERLQEFSQLLDNIGGGRCSRYEAEEKKGEFWYRRVK